MPGIADALTQAAHNPDALTAPEVRAAAPVYRPTIKAFHAKTATPLDLEPAVAELAYKRGQVRFASNDSVHVRLPDGTISAQPANKLGEILDAGGHLASAADFRKYDLDRRSAGPGGMAKAGVLGLATGVTGGASDLALGLLSLRTPNTEEEEREALAGPEEAVKAIKAASPLTSGVSELGGMIAQTALTGGAGGIGAIGRLGENVAGRLVGTEAKSLAGRLAQKGVASGLSNAAQEALITHTNAMSEKALGEPSTTAEKYLANGAMAGLIGAGAGIGGELLGKAGKAVFSSLTKPKAADIEGVLTKSLGDEASSEGVGGLMKKARSALEDARLTHNIEETRNVATRDVTQHLDTLIKGTDELTDEAKGVLKRDQLRKSVSAAEPEAVAKHSADTIASTRATVREMLDNPDEYGNAQRLKRLDKGLDGIEKKIAEAGARGDNAEQFALLDDTKRAIGEESRMFQQARNQADPWLKGQARSVFSKLGDLDQGGGLYEGLRTNLENEQVWGKAAAGQKAINSAWSEYIGAQKQMGRAVGVTSQIGEENFGRKLFGADAAKIDRYVQGLTDPNKDLAHQAMAKYTSAAKGLAKAIGEHFELPPDKAKLVAAVGASSEATTKALDDIGTKLARANKVRAAMELEEKSAKGLAMAGGLVGHVIGGPIGAGIGSAAGFLAENIARPRTRLMQLAQLEGVAKSVNARVASAVKGLFEAEGESVRRAGAKSAIKQVADAKGSLIAKEKSKTAIGAGVVGEAVREQYVKRAKAVAAWQANPDMLAQHISQHVTALQEHAPQTASAVAKVAQRGAAFLQSKLPTPPKADGMFGKPGIPSQEEQAKFNRYVDAVEDPAGVLKHLSSGRISSEEVEAIQAVYPDIYGQMRDHVMQELSGREGKDVPYSKRVTLGLIFGIDAVPEATPDSVKQATATYAAQPQQPKGDSPSPGKSTPKASQTQTPSQRIEAGAAGG